MLAPNQLAETESAKTRCSQSTLSIPSAWSSSRLLSNRSERLAATMATVAIARATSTSIRSSERGNSRRRTTVSTGAVGSTTLGARSAALPRRSVSQSNAGRSKVIATTQSSRPVPAISPSSRSPWKLVVNASRNTAALVSEPVMLPGTAVRIVSRIAPKRAAFASPP